MSSSPEGWPGSISSLHGGLPVPQVTILEAERVAALFGLTVRAQPLGSQQDSNFLLADGGSVLGVLKIANPAFSAAEIEAQDAAAAHIAAARPDLRVATVTHGPAEVPVDGGPVDGGRALARVLRFLPGGTLAGAGRYLSPRVVAGLGAVAGQVSLALSSFEHPGLDRVLQWDLRHALRVVDALAGHVRDEDLRGRVTDAAAAAWSRVEPLAGRLPWQAVHGDVTDDNVVCLVERGLRTPDGIIDFGDLTSSWAVGELAVAITSVLRHAGAEPCSVLPAVRAFGELRPLSAAEAAALWPLVVLRAAVLVVSGEQQAAIDGVNDYVTGALEHERRLFERAMSVPAEVMTGLILAELGLAGEPLRGPVRQAWLGLDLGRCAVLDLSVAVRRGGRGGVAGAGARGPAGRGPAGRRVRRRGHPVRRGAADRVAGAGGGLPRDRRDRDRPVDGRPGGAAGPADGARGRDPGAREPAGGGRARGAAAGPAGVRGGVAVAGRGSGAAAGIACRRHGFRG